MCTIKITQRFARLFFKYILVVSYVFLCTESECGSRICGICVARQVCEINWVLYRKNDVFGYFYYIKKSPKLFTDVIVLFFPFKIHFESIEYDIFKPRYIWLKLKYFQTMELNGIITLNVENCFCCNNHSFLCTEFSLIYIYLIVWFSRHGLNTLKETIDHI